MAKIFDLDEAERILTLVRPILADLAGCFTELDELASENIEDAESVRGVEHSLREREVREEIERHLIDLEDLGCYMQTPSDLLVRFPAVRGHRFGFYEYRAGDDALSEWTPASTTAVERGVRSQRRAKRNS